MTHQYIVLAKELCTANPTGHRLLVYPENDAEIKIFESILIIGIYIYIYTYIYINIYIYILH